MQTFNQFERLEDVLTHFIFHQGAHGLNFVDTEIVTAKQAMSRLNHHIFN